MTQLTHERPLNLEQRQRLVDIAGITANLELMIINLQTVVREANKALPTGHQLRVLLEEILIATKRSALLAASTLKRLG